MGVQYNTIKVPLYPTAEQAELFAKTFGCCRYLWNRTLADQEKTYQETGKHLLLSPAHYKQDAPFLKEVDSQALIQEHNKLAQAFRNYFRNPDSFRHPKFKRKKDDAGSFTACNHVVGNSATIYITRDAVRMTKAGLVRATFPRRPRSGWKLTRITVERTKTGKYYGCLLFACPVATPKPIKPTPETTVGLKYSISHFYVTDTGAAADPPHWMKRSQQKLVVLQQKLARLQPGSKNYQDMVQKYRLLHEHIANQRRDFLHKESRRIANAWDAVCIREDSLKEIAQKLGANVPDSGFGMFREMLRYKLERQGKQLLEVGRYVPTTKVCSVCGAVNEHISPKARRWRCPECGAEHRRDENAAVNIKAQGLLQYEVSPGAL